MKMKKVTDIHVSANAKVKDLVYQLHEGGGFTASELWVGAEILREMQKGQCTRFLSFTANLLATGLRGVIKDLVKARLFDAIITTGGALDHDIARCYADYYHGSYELEDGELHRQGINRLGNVLIPRKSYGAILEREVGRMLNEIYRKRKRLSCTDLICEFGKGLNESSVLYCASKQEIRVLVPGLYDGAVGSQVWLFWQQHKDFQVDMLCDQQILADLVFNAKSLGALMLGGGISKHHTIWWSQFIDGLDYAVYITTAQPWDGSLSGARLSEAISWGKVKEEAKKVTIQGDATVILPLLVACLEE